MAFDHNDHYHPLILTSLPMGAQRVLDVGCGTGGLARLLSSYGLDVDAIDPYPPVIDEAKAAGARGPGRITYRVGDAVTDDLPADTYDGVTCVASLHHMPFDVVDRLTRTLRPGGRLVVVGLRRYSWRDLPMEVVAIPAHHAISRERKARRGPEPAPAASVPPLRDPELTIAEMTQLAVTLIPGAKFRRLLYWRYLMVWEKPGTG